MVQLNPVPVFGAKKIPLPFDGNFSPAFRRNGKRSLVLDVFDWLQIDHIENGFIIIKPLIYFNR